jgi:hypothetical protein
MVSGESMPVQQKSVVLKPEQCRIPRVVLEKLKAHGFVIGEDAPDIKWRLHPQGWKLVQEISNGSG